jgi:mono/diheme cytochrome c family protein
VRKWLTAAALTAAVLLPDGPTPVLAREPVLAQHDYALHCAGCHGFDGSGSAQVPSLSSMARYLDVPGGRDYVVRVPGVAQAPLSDSRLADLLTWLVERHGANALQPPFTPEEVATLRSRPLLDPFAVRRGLLAELGRSDSVLPR